MFSNRLCWVFWLTFHFFCEAGAWDRWDLSPSLGPGSCYNHCARLPQQGTGAQQGSRFFQRESSQLSWKLKHVSENTKTLQLLFASINTYLENCLKFPLYYALENNHLKGKHSNLSQETSSKHKSERALLDLEKDPHQGSAWAHTYGEGPQRQGQQVGNKKLGVAAEFWRVIFWGGWCALFHTPPSEKTSSQLKQSSVFNLGIPPSSQGGALAGHSKQGADFGGVKGSSPFRSPYFLILTLKSSN